MIEDNTPTVTSRRRRPTQIMRIRLESARRLQNLNAKSKARRAATRLKRDKENVEMLQNEGSHTFNTAPRVPKIKKNKISRPPPPEAKYRKRQRCKTWLPTHMFHAKRAHMATSNEPVWRFALPLSPTEKSYRPTHRARGARGAVAWDMSYMSTVQLEGTEGCIEAVLKSVGLTGTETWGMKGKKWRAGTRFLQAWAFERDHPEQPVAPVTLIWCAQPKSEDVEMADADKLQAKSTKPRRKLWIRVHPSAFLQLWQNVLESAKRQNPPVMVEDLRFEIGSIEITGPGSTEALLAALRPVQRFDGRNFAAESPEATWSGLRGVSNPSSLPQNAILSFAISDPRLQFPPRTIKEPDNESYMADLAVELSRWSPDQTQGPSILFDRPSRLAAARQLPSQKAINRRRALAGPGKHPSPQHNDPQIPVMMLANRPQTSSKRNSIPGSWIVLLPWKCVVPVWYTLMFYPLSSGGNPRFGGLKEQQQLAFEAGEPWFPGDFPGTRAGWEWGQREAEKSRVQWERRPKGRRTEFDSLVLGEGRPKGEIGWGWACDWQRLVRGPAQGSESDEANDKAAKDLPPKDREAEVTKPVSPMINSTLPPSNLRYLRYTPGDTNRILTNLLRAPIDSSTFATIYLTLSNRGTPTPCARIYRLPSDPTLRQKWLDSASKPKGKPSEFTVPRNLSSLSDEEARRQLAESLISTPKCGQSESDHLVVPTEEDLIGFVTSGNYNLSEGKGTGIGTIQLSKVLSPDCKLSERKMCIVRAAGERVGRLGVWELV